MRHRVAGRTLGRRTNHRIAMWRNMATALFTHHQITTTIPKAKSLQPFVEKLITAAKKGDLASRRRVIAKLGGDQWMLTDEDAEGTVRHPRKANRPGGYTGKLLDAPRIVKHLFDDIAPMYADREGGYTRIIKLGINRLGDGSDLCVIQLVGTEEQGPQVTGQHSRRRDKANKRMEFAAKLRKGGEDETAQQTPQADSPVAEADSADAEQQAEQQTPDSPDESSGDEAAAGEEKPAGS